MRFLSLVIFSLLSCTHQTNRSGKVTIIKQWHLSPNIDSRNILASKKLPQFRNQKEIYNLIEKKLNDQDIFIIAEGCEAGQEIDDHFLSTFNGWNMRSLGDSSANQDYDNILTSIPLKIKSKYPLRVTAICGDNEELIKKNQLAISDANGFFGFYIRLKQNLENPQKFLNYAKALEETQKIEIKDPVQYSKEHAIASITKFKRYISERNKVFIRKIKENISKNPILIVGGLHAKELTQELEREGIDKETITPEGYPESNEELIDQLMKELH